MPILQHKPYINGKMVSKIFKKLSTWFMDIPISYIMRFVGFFCLVQISRKKSAPLKIRKVLQIFPISSLLFFDKMPFLIDIPVFSVHP